jgi:Ca-activated chloride channel family protein
MAQSFDEVHIQPRTATPEKAELLIPRSPGVKMIRKYVDVVLVPVTIMDTMNRLVKGLRQENFLIFDSKRRQDIRYFCSQDAPVSLGIVLDVSGSMSSKIARAREAVMEFMNSANPQDEFFMVTFSDRPELISDFTQNPADIQSRLVNAIPKGRTSLLDAIYVALDKMKSAKYQRKALLVISDGGDNHSRYTRRDVESRIKEADVTLYGVGIYDRAFPTYEELLGPELLDKLSTITGGRAYTVDNPNDLSDVAKAIGTELRNQYVIGYLPSSVPRDGKWHKIKVKLNKPKKVKLPPLMVYARTGYYAPAE